MKQKTRKELENDIIFWRTLSIGFLVLFILAFFIAIAFQNQIIELKQLVQYYYENQDCPTWTYSFWLPSTEEFTHIAFNERGGIYINGVNLSESRNTNVETMFWDRTWNQTCLWNYGEGVDNIEDLTNCEVLE